jgi:hypothetical protein
MGEAEKKSYVKELLKQQEEIGKKLHHKEFI